MPPSLPTTTSTHPDIPPFPTPSTFSLLPEIYLLLTRLSAFQSSLPSSSNTNPSSNNDNTSHPTVPSTSQIEPKDLPSLTYPIKQKINKAKEAISALPDVERSVEEQEAEIRGLEARIEAVRRRVRELGVLAAEGRREKREEGDVVMVGVEG